MPRATGHALADVAVGAVGPVAAEPVAARVEPVAAVAAVAAAVVVALDAVAVVPLSASLHGMTGTSTVDPIVLGDA